MEFPEPRDEDDQRVIEIIEQHGIFINNVFDPDGIDPSFAYSMGMKHSYRQPELIIFGLSRKSRIKLLNVFASYFSKGKRVSVEGELVDWALPDQPLYLAKLHPAARDHYATWNSWLHNSHEFDMLQIVWPFASGHWPWDESIPAQFKDSQPFFGETIYSRD